MNTIYIILQVGLSLYCLDLIIQKQSHYAWGVCILGVHLICYLLSAIVKNEKVRRVLGGLDNVWLMGSIWVGTKEVMILMCLLFVETIVIEKNKRYLAILGFSLIGINLLNMSQMREFWGWYFIIGAVGGFIYFNEKRLQYLVNTNQNLKEQVIKLNNRIEEVGKAKTRIEYVTRVNERNQLAQKLHDKIGHTLAGNIMQLEVVKLIFKSDEYKAMELITQITDNLRSGMDDIRITLRELKPEQSEMGIQRIKQLLVDLESKHGIKTYLTFEGELESIDVGRWQVILDNLREAITNMLKYSTGDELRVAIHNFNQVIRVSFSDNGKIEGEVKKGLGLLGMEERMVANRGRMTVNTDEGFQINMIFNK